MNQQKRSAIRVHLARAHALLGGCEHEAIGR
jgi:hypothetical protein